MPDIPSQTVCWTTDLSTIGNLTQCNRSTPTITTPDSVLVRINAVSLNYKDGETISGQFKHHKAVHAPETELIPCSDAAGVVVQVGDGVRRWKVGDRVLTLAFPEFETGGITEEILAVGTGSSIDGVLTQYQVFKEHQLVRTPAYLTDEEACNFQIAGTTAWMALNGMRSMGQPGGSGEAVLLQGTGGVSILGLLLAKASGATVIITSSSDAKLARAKSLGADHTINYNKTPDWDVEVLRLTHNRGVDIIFENGGAATTAKSMSCVRFGGLINGIGYVGGKMDPKGGERVNINVMALKRNLTYKGLLCGPKDRFEELLAFAEEKGIHPIVDRVFGFAEAKEALQYLWDGSHFGKVVVKIE